MLVKASRGIVYSSTTAKAVRKLIEGLETSAPAARVITLLEIFRLLADDKKFKLLCAPHKGNESISPSDRPRIDRALDYIHKNSNPRS